MFLIVFKKKRHIQEVSMKELMKNWMQDVGTYKKLERILLGVYGVVAIVFMVSLARLNMLPIIYLVIIGVLLVIIGVIVSFNHGRRVSTFLLASSITMMLILLLVIGATYAQRTGQVIDDITTIEYQKDVISVFVLYDDPAQTIEDARDYQFGKAQDSDRDNVRRTIDNIGALLGQRISFTEFVDLVRVADALLDGEIEGIIANDAMMRIVGNIEGYEWVQTGLRVLKIDEHQIMVEAPFLETAQELPESFIVFLSGIDTYGSVSARSRSDTNILLVVNTVDREMLLLYTPRDASVTFDMSGDNQDKLTHAGIYGVEQSISALERLYDITIDYFLKLNFTGFMELIDALGGIEVYSEYNFTVYPIRTYNVGPNHLSGIEALAFLRERDAFATGDYQRAIHQMEVIRALVAGATSPTVLSNYHQLMTAVSDSFQSNMPRDHIAHLVRMQLADLRGWNISSFSASGSRSMGQTFSMPGHMLSLINIYDQSIEEANRLISETMGME
jgi:LCP family protein required for cell wall assembly